MGQVKKGGIRHGSGSEKWGALGTDQIKKGGSLLRHMPVLGIYGCMLCGFTSPPPPPLKAGSIFFISLFYSNSIFVTAIFVLFSF